MGFNISPITHPLNIKRTFIDLTGQRFGRLLVMKRIENDKWGTLQYLCLCDCGQETVVRGGHLRNGNVKSCGCLYKEGNYSTHKHTKTPIYYIYHDMIQRCNNFNHHAYERYGGRNPPITVCSRWSKPNGEGFANFLKDMGEKPKGLTLDRIDNNLGYYKKNCRWATRKKQQRNRKNSKYVIFKNKSTLLIELAEEYNINIGTLRSRLSKGVPLKDALLTPVILQKRRVEYANKSKNS